MFFPKELLSEADEDEIEPRKKKEREKERKKERKRKKLITFFFSIFNYWHYSSLWNIYQIIHHLYFHTWSSKRWKSSRTVQTLIIFCKCSRTTDEESSDPHQKSPDTLVMMSLESRVLVIITSSFGTSSVSLIISCTFGERSSRTSSRTSSERVEMSFRWCNICK